MNTNAANQNEILKLEQKYWDAMKKQDVETAVSLTRFPALVSGPQGAMRISEPEYRKMMQSQNADHFKNVEIKNPQVELLSGDTALIQYSTEVNGMKMIDVSTWVREGGKWRCAFHSENPQADASKQMH